VRDSLIFEFEIIVSFMLFTVFPLVNLVDYATRYHKCARVGAKLA